MSTPLALLPKVRSRTLMDAMQHMPCSLRISTFLGQPCAPQATVVGAHLAVGGKGMASKTSDLCVVAACFTCHQLLDGVDKRGMAIRERYPAAFHEQVLRALAETHSRLLEAGVITVQGGEIVS